MDTNFGRVRRPSNTNHAADSTDMFLDLAKNDPHGDGGGNESVKQPTKTNRQRKSSAGNSQSPLPPSPSRKSVFSQPTSAGRSFSNHTPSHALNTNHDASQRKDSPSYGKPLAFTPEHRRVTTGETNFSMRPFRPSYRPSYLSSLSHESPRGGTSSQTSPSAWNTEPHFPGNTADGVESVGSATAVSTVWDEAEELKNRIEQYRTGRRTHTGNVIAEEGEDRPHTATTMTTNSTTSHTFEGSALARTGSESGRAVKKSHQLLETALGRVRAEIDPLIYHALASCAADAIQASSILEANESTSRANDTITTSLARRSSSDKRLKRKVDSLCQSLTELCIALSDQAKSRHANRSSASPGSQVHTHVGVGSSVLSSASASRYSSIGATQCSNNVPTPTTTNNDSPITYTHRTLSRSNTTRSHDDNSTDKATTIRAPSRAATDINESSYTSRRDRGRERDPQKTSRDYIDNYPLPPPDSISPSLRKSLATKHSNISFSSALSAATYDVGDRAVDRVAVGDRMEERRRNQPTNLTFSQERGQAQGQNRSESLASPSLLEQRLSQRRDRGREAKDSPTNIYSDYTSRLGTEDRPSARLRALSGSGLLSTRGNKSREG